MFNRTTKNTNGLMKESRCFVIFKEILSPADDIMRNGVALAADYSFWRRPAHTVAATDKALQEAYLNIMLKTGGSYFDFRNHLEVSEQENVFTKQEIDKAILKGIEQHYWGVLSPFVRRYSAEFDATSESLKTLLKNAMPDIVNGKAVYRTTSEKKKID